MTAYDAPLEIIDTGAVTAVGMNAAQTSAAIRAGIKRFSPIEAQILDYEEPRVGARVSADPRLRLDEDTWLLNLAGRALVDAAPEAKPDTAILWLVPESHRGYTLSAFSDSELLRRFEDHVQRHFSPASRVLRNGAAECVEGLGVAHELLRSRAAAEVLVGGADSLLRLFDLQRLERVNRLIGPLQSQGVMPGEGAAWVRVALGEPLAKDTEDTENTPEDGPRRVVVHGLGIDFEPERKTVLGTEYSVGDAFVSAIETACDDGDVSEPEIDFVSGNFNGERYDAWEMAHAKGRGYPTRRERLPSLWPVGSTGDVGVAGGVIALVAVASALAEQWGDGPTASVHVRSDTDMRGVALLRGHASA